MLFSLSESPGLDGDMGTTGSATKVVGGGMGTGWGDPLLGNDGPDDEATGGSP